MQPRLAAAAVAAAIVVIGATGCNILTPQATQIEYDPSDGVSGSTGTVEIHNAMLIGERDGDSMNLAVTFTNEGEATFVEVRVGDDSQDVRVGEGVTTFGFQDEQIIVPAPEGVVLGSLQNVSFTADGAEPAGLGVPTIAADMVGYETLAPSAE